MLNEKKVQQAIDRRLSGLAASEERKMRIRTAVHEQRREERPVTRKFPAMVAIALAIMMMTSVAVAAGLGLFGQLAGSGPDIDRRLNALDAQSISINKTFTVQRGATLTIDQAYYDGTRVFISWTMKNCADEITTGTGKPDIVNYNTKRENFILAEHFGSEDPALQKAIQYLDGSEPRWMHVEGVSPHDCLEALVNGEYVTLMIIGGDDIHQPDGSIVGWKECELPEELLDAEELTVCFGTFVTDYTDYQDGTTLYTSSSIGSKASTEYWPFTVKKDDSSVKMTGRGGNDTWSATADMVLSKVDLKGEITVTDAPQSWLDYWLDWEYSGATPDVIDEWKVYINGTPTDMPYAMEGIGAGAEEGSLRYSVCFQHVDPTAEIELVPSYRVSGDKPEESIFLVPAN